MASAPLRGRTAVLGARYPRHRPRGCSSSSRTSSSLGGLGLLRLYQPMSAADFWRIVARGRGAACWSTTSSRSGSCGGCVAPARRWLDGERDAGTTADGVARARRPARSTSSRRRGVVAAGRDARARSASTPWSSSELPLVRLLHPRGRRAGRAALRVAAALLRDGVAHAAGARGRRARAARRRRRWPRAGVPLRWKLLGALPVINMFTGVVVAGLSSTATARADRPRRSTCSSRSVVAFTISLELTLLLARSMLGPIEDLRDATERVEQRRLQRRACRWCRATRPGELAAVVQRDGRRARRSARRCARRSAPTSTRRWPSGCSHEGVELAGEEVEVVGPVPRHPRLHRVRRARERARGRRRRSTGSSTLVVPIAGPRTAATRTSSSATGCWRCSAPPTAAPTTPTARVAAALEIAAAVEEHYGGRLRHRHRRELGDGGRPARSAAGGRSSSR